MADIELVIKIPEHLYSVIKNKECTMVNLLTIAVENGKPLPKGHWIWELDETPSTPVSSYELNYAGWVCSCCHEFPDDICEWDNPDEPPTYNYCPNCGADMRNKENN